MFDFMDLRRTWIYVGYSLWDNFLQFSGNGFSQNLNFKPLHNREISQLWFLYVIIYVVSRWCLLNPPNGPFSYSLPQLLVEKSIPGARDDYGQF